MRNRIILILGVVVLALISLIVVQRNKIKKQDTQIGSLTNNMRAYEDLGNNNRVLQLTVSDLRDSNDKMIQTLDSTRNSLKLSKNSIKQASAIKTIIKDTIIIDIPRDTTKITCDFSVNKQINVETSISIQRIDSQLIVVPDISNTQYLFVYQKKEYRNSRKNWFDRLFHWDWKKDVISRYEIQNSNPIIKIEDTRIIEIKE